MKNNKKSKEAGNGATHSYAGHVVNVEIAAGAFLTLSKKKGDSRRFSLSDSSGSQLAVLIGLASSALAIGKKLHVEFSDSGSTEPKVIAMRLGPKEEASPAKAQPQVPEGQAAPPA